MLEVQHTEWLPTFGQPMGYIPIIPMINVLIANEPGMQMRLNNNDNTLRHASMNGFGASGKVCIVYSTTYNRQIG